MKDSKKSKDYDALCQVVKEAKYLSKERRIELASALHRIPKSNRTIEPTELNEWFELHHHSDRYHGCIGGHITKTECYTSIGTLVTYNCSSCGEEAYVADPNF